MKPIVIALTALLISAPLVWADEDKTEPRKGSVRVDDLPKPIPELLQKIQSLSQKIEPEISRLGSRLGEELTTTVKKLCDELQCQEKPESK
ncbi:MAG TPA: hypothetical protein VFQ02_06745 [Nitrospira sp.]|nr:hypothetical protein [Nitrospira sp.]